MLRNRKVAEVLADVSQQKEKRADEVGKQADMTVLSRNSIFLIDDVCTTADQMVPGLGLVLTFILRLPYYMLTRLMDVLNHGEHSNLSSINQETPRQWLRMRQQSSKLPVEKPADETLMQRTSGQQKPATEPPSLSQNDIDKRWANARKKESDKAEIIDACTEVCCYIEDKYSESVLHVQPAYDSTDKDHIKFIVTTKEDSDNTDFGYKYTTVVRRANTYSNEAKKVMEYIEKKKIKLSFEDSEKIKYVINSRAEELLKNHRYLSVISGSAVRSRGFRKGEHELFQEACIILYVQTKGKIPLDETEFPKDLDRIPVDVMEGEFQTCALSTEYQSNLCMGCQIQAMDRDDAGSLGGFVFHPEYGLSAITCAHVVLNDAEIKYLQQDGKASCTKSVFQPCDSYKQTKWGNMINAVLNIGTKKEQTTYFGKAREVIYKHGKKKRPGVDLAVIQIDERPPINGKCPSAKTKQKENVDFETGLACFSLNGINNDVVKFGGTTEETCGFVKFEKAAVKRINHENDREWYYHLYNQFEIKSSRGDFVRKGDSGSLVFKKDVYGDFVCIGMVVGCIVPGGNGIVTPISAILSELGVTGFKDFRSMKVNAILNRLSNIESKLSVL